jgi:hypothetical protein
VIHHTGKDRERGERGHSSLRGNVDTSIEVVKDATSSVSTATIVKQRDGKEGLSRSFKLLPVTIGYDEDQAPITSCAVTWTEAPTPKDTPGRPAKNKHTALQTLRAMLERGDGDGRVIKLFEGRDNEHGREVKLAEWEAECRKTNCFGVDAQSFKKTFRRASEELMGITGVVGFDPKRQVVWLKAQDQLPFDECPF